MEEEARLAEEQKLKEQEEEEARLEEEERIAEEEKHQQELEDNIMNNLNCPSDKIQHGSNCYLPGEQVSLVDRMEDEVYDLEMKGTGFEKTLAAVWNELVDIFWICEKMT